MGMTLDEQLTEIIAAARRQIMTQFDERMKSLAVEIGQSASSDRTAAIGEVRLAAEAEIAKRSQEAVVAALAEASRRHDEAVAATRAELAERVDEAAAAARAEAISTTRAEADQRLTAALAETLAEAARRHDEAVAATRAELAERVDEAIAATRAELAERADEAATAARAEAISTTRAEADHRLAAAVSAATQEAEETARQTATQALVESQVAARHSELAQIDRVVEAVRRFDQARSLTDVLNTLGDVTSREAPRVALFLVRGSRLAGWRTTGFGPAVDPRTVDVGSEESSLLWRAIASGRSLSTTDAAPGERLTTPFGELGHDAAGLAVPVRVGGETVAVIYADDAADGPRVVPSAWPEVVEVMARHAARCLEVLTMSRAVPPIATAPPPPIGPRVTPPERSVTPPRTEDHESARRFARLLVSEIKLYHEAAVTEGRHGHNLADRLRTEIDRARKLYEERVPIEIRSRADYFGQELVRTLANGDPALLGASRT